MVQDLPPVLRNHPAYQVLRLLGRGSMGPVYLAHHTALDCPVALKVVSPELVNRPGVQERFLREYQAKTCLNHPHVLRTFGAELLGDPPDVLLVVIVEYLEGRTLDTLLRDAEIQGRPLPVADACRYARHAALGLQHAHEQGFVHRDVTPYTLMLTPEGLVKVHDLSLARRLDGPAADRADEYSGFLGMSGYASPEQAMDARQADARSDVYSLGCTLFALLTGRPPFTEETMTKTILAHLQKPPPRLRALRPDAPLGLSLVVRRMLAKDPADRYPTMAEVAGALSDFC